MSDGTPVRPTPSRPASPAGRFRLRAGRIAGALVLVAVAACTLPQQLLFSLLPDGTFTMPLSKLERLSTRNQDRIDALTARGDWAGLAAFARENLQTDVTSGDWWTVKGAAEARLGDWRSARASFAEAVRYSPDSADAWIMMAQADGRLGDRGRAIRALEQGQDAHRGVPRVTFFLAEEYRLAGRNADAERAYHDALRLSPDFPEALHGLAIVQARLGKAEASQRTLAVLRPEHPALARNAEEVIARR